ncbi:FAD-dependent monooxygenase [Streptomyces yaanensis]|uniref:FAD-dependent monooxygenase n=1 Tax=Streptomyces yaanensis TaxID=1142239 RepID=A0ABV7S5N9_9ACTN
MLDATRPGAVLHHDVNELPIPLPSYTVGRVALLGDAAHVMTRNLGQGACQALEVAVTLAAALAAEHTVEAELARYDAEHRPHARQSPGPPGRLGQQLSHPVAVTLRSAALRLTPPRSIRMILRHPAGCYHAWPDRRTGAARHGSRSGAAPGA